ncbi:MAG: 2-hydroxy-3-oxopropionate reductase [Anaerolineae bacterium]|nr:NAD(P)-dependent oxidoreductase [Anaerolineales bacterium]MCQ3973865.1 2-hydroxy-3-oxopropionate reductase [Anaerolineae bacterium]
MTQKIGFIGLGLMGSRMALNLVRAGYAVTVYNRTPEKTKPLAEAGATVAGSLAEVAQNAEIVITMVSDSAALQSVVLGPGGLLEGLQPDAVLIDMSTVDPKISRQIAEAVRVKGAHMLDAPVSGSTMMAEQGALSIMVGGEESIHERVREVLLKMGSRTTHVGPNGAAASLKLAVNIIIGVTMQVLAESIVLAERAGVTPEIAIEVLSNSAVASPFLKYKAPQLLQPLGPAAFTANMMQKDFTLALQMARELGVPLPATAAANEVMTMARGLGLGEHDFAAVTNVIRQFSKSS